MTTETTINICGKDVKMRYCAATETGFERVTNKPIGIFMEQGKAMMLDFIYLAYAAIIAAYSKDNEEPTVSSEEIMYEATPQEISDMMEALLETKKAWYHVPDVVKPETDNVSSEDSQKNAESPTT